MALFQPAKHALDDVALSVLGPIKQPWQARLGFALHHFKASRQANAFTLDQVARGSQVDVLVGYRRVRIPPMRS